MCISWRETGWWWTDNYPPPAIYDGVLGSTPRRQNIQGIPCCSKTFECRLWCRWNQLSRSSKSYGENRSKRINCNTLYILSPKDGMPIICIVQDAMVSMYLLTKRKKEIERLMLMQYLVDLDDLSRFNEIVSKLGYTGKALFSFLLPRQLWHQSQRCR